MTNRTYSPLIICITYEYRHLVTSTNVRKAYYIYVWLATAQRSQLTVIRKHQKLCQTTVTLLSSDPVDHQNI